MLQQQGHHGIGALVVANIEPEFLKVPVYPHQFGRLVGQQFQEPLKVSPPQRVLEILDDVELDATRLENVERAPGFASTRVVIDDDLSHPPTLPQRGIDTNIVVTLWC